MTEQNSPGSGGAHGALGEAEYAEFVELAAGEGFDDSLETIAYCRIGERSSHTWFVLSQLLGKQGVKNYDGSWLEYGSLVGVPIELGEPATSTAK